jgi:zinc transporter, ZIP family
LLLVFSILPFFSTTLGGLAALRLRHRLHPIMAFAAGVLVATALVDLLPEATELVGAASPLPVGASAVVGFLLFSGLEALVHRQSWEHQHPPLQDPQLPHAHPGEQQVGDAVLGWVGPVGLIVHSTLDGLAIGLGFAANAELGLIVALAVLAHDFADGMNVVTLALASGRGTRAAVGVLALDAVAPPLGVFLSTFVVPESMVLGLMLALFGGVFLAIGAGHLLPEAQHQRPNAAPWLVVLAAAGAGLVVAVRSQLS